MYKDLIFGFGLVGRVAPPLGDRLFNNKSPVHCGGVTLRIGKEEIIIFGCTEDCIIFLSDKFVIKNHVIEVSDRAEGVGVCFHCIKIYCFNLVLQR